ncbi:MAG: cytochrome c oxidase subunit II [Cyanobacteria bacterium]|nr:cytochrome c oxidase subunit II [Cyanobacteriota bacterium]
MSASGSTASGSGPSPAPGSGSPGRGGPGIDRGAVLLVTLGVGLALLASRWLMAQVPRWLPPQASTAAPLVDDLFALEVGIGCFLLLGCTAVIAWTLLFDRADKYDRDDGEPIEGNLKLEITWTVIPLVVVLLLAAQAIRVNGQLASLGGKVRVAGAAEALRLVGVDGVAGFPGPTSVQSSHSSQSSQPSAAQASRASRSMSSTGPSPGVGDPAAELGPVVVIARQWSWEFVYPDGVRSAELHLPVNRPVRFRLVSLDVLHAMSIPAFRLRQDVVPGSVIDYRLTPSREGRYRLRDSLFSGAYFASNQTDVVVESAEAFERWRQAARRSPLAPSPNAATELWSQRQERGNRGWATVPPAPPPLVNVPLDPEAAHEG